MGLVGILGSILIGCAAPGPSATSSDASDASASPQAPSPIVASPAPPATTGNPAPASGGIAVDAALLDPLPNAVGDIQLIVDGETAAEIAGSLDLGPAVQAIAVGLYPSLEDHAVVTMARLAPGTFDAEWFRDWRDTFDAGVCERAGGVDDGRSTMEIDGRPTFRSTCVEGVVIYHTYLETARAVLSIQGMGSRDLGRQIVAGLSE